MSADSRRTCIGCRTTEHPDQLVRVATEPGDDGLRAVVDRTGRLGGRGAWLHPTRECLDSALRRRAFRRAFRAVVDTEAVAPELDALVSLRGQPGDRTHECRPQPSPDGSPHGPTGPVTTSARG